MIATTVCASLQQLFEKDIAAASREFAGYFFGFEMTRLSQMVMVG
jgi:hypothetical protein